MKELKTKLAPVMKMIDQLDVQTVLAVSGVMFLLTLILGGVPDVIALISGIWIGVALYRKLLV